jgi:hypothetical protein
MKTCGELEVQLQVGFSSLILYHRVNCPPVPIVLEADWTPEPVWKLREREKNIYCPCWESDRDSSVAQPMA